MIEDSIIFLADLTSVELDQIVNQASILLNQGGVLIAPTETVVGIFCSDKNKIFKVKNRPEQIPLQMVGTRDNFLKEIDTSSVAGKKAFALAEMFWPGPLSIVCNTKNYGEQCLRVPRHYLLERILAEVSVPVFASSFNRHGEAETTDLNILADLSKKISFKKMVLLELIPKKPASTVIKITDNELTVLRGDKDFLEKIQEK